MKSILLKANRLVLRPPVPQDAEAIQRLVCRKRVAELTSHIPHPYPGNGGWEWITGAQRDWREGGTLPFVICLRPTGEVVGSISMIDDGDDGGIRLGYWIGLPYWGHWYASEAIHRIIRFGFNQLRSPRFYAYHFRQHLSCGLVMQRAGLLYEGVQPLGACRFGEHYDRVCYGITAEQWRANLRTFSLA